ncbi:MAG: gliding motility-associated C-terminal domain-containing protein [Bacteroidia bacterium]
MNILQRIALLMGLVLFGLNVHATHIVGADLTYASISTAANTYRVTLTLYRDCTPASQADFDQTATLFFFNGRTGRQEFTRSIRKDFNDAPKIVPFNGEACLTAGQLNSICVEYGVYTTIVTLPPLTGGYDIGWSRCCRNNSVTNIQAGGNQSQGISLLAHVPTDIYRGNSMPLFNQLAPIFLCSNQPFIFDHSATDADGDSLVYLVTNPYSGENNQGLGTSTTAPVINLGNPMGPPPYRNVRYNPGFSFIDPFASGNFQIDPQSGFLSLTPTSNGIFVFAISVFEYRNGTLLSENKRDFQINVLTCQPQGNPPNINSSLTTIPVVGNDSVFTSSGVIFVQPGKPFCYTTTITDPNPNDTVVMFPASAAFGLGGTFQPPLATLNQTGVNPAMGNVCWTPGCDVAGQRVDLIIGGQDPNDCLGYNVVFDTVRVRVGGGTPPTLSHTLPGGGDTAIIKVGQEFCYIYDAADADPFNGVIVTPTSGPFVGLGGTAVAQDTGVNPIRGTVCWTPGCADAGQTFILQLTARDTNYCNKTFPRRDEVVLIVEPLADVVTPDSQTICFGSEVTLSAVASGPGTFSWLPSAGMDDPTSPTPTVRGSVSQNYIVTFTDTFGCDHLDTTWLDVLALPNPNVQPDFALVCAGDTTSLRVSASGTLTRIAWSPAASLSNTNQRTVLAFPTTTTTYQVIVADDNGCFDTTTATVQVNRLPNVDAGSDTVQCGNVPIQLEATGGTTYSWTPTGSLLNPSTATPTADPDTTTMYTVIVTDGNGCINTDSVLVRAFNADAGPDIFVCIGDTTRLAAGLGPVGFQWQAHPSLFDRADVPDPQVFTLASRTYTLVATDTSGCTDTDDVLVTVNPLPVVTVSNPDQYVCSGAPTVLTATGGVTYLWTPAATLDDSSLASPTASPINTGPNVVDSTWYYVTVTDANGCVNNDSIGIEVRLRPLLTISTDTFVCPGDTVPLFVQGGFGVRRTGWRFDGSIGDTTFLSTTRSEANAFPTEGTWYVGEVEAVWGCANEDSVWVYHIEPDAGVDSTICEGDTIQLLGGGGVSYSWSPATGLSNPNIAQPLASPTATTTYTVTVTDSLGCVDTDEVIITVEVAPFITITGDEEICINDTANLQANGGINYQWITSDPSISSLTATNVTAVPIDDMRYILVGEGANGCIARDTLDMTVHPLPIVEAGQETTVCRNQPAILQGSGAQNYSWSPGEWLNDSLIANPVALPDSNKVFRLLGTDENGCQNRDSTRVLVIQLPEARISPDDSICLYQEIDLRVRGNADRYVWSTGEETTDITVGPRQSTQYWVIPYGEEGCAGDTLYSDLYVEENVPRAAFSPLVTEGFVQLDVPFVNESQFATNYIWRYGDDSTSTRAEVEHTHTYGREGQFVVTLIADNNIGCPDSVQYNFIDVWGEELFLPTAFTPNSDGNNDFYYIPNGGYSRMDVRIFNRWGRLVYQSNDPNFRWDGRSAGGQSVPEGVLVIQVEAQTFEGVTIRRTGSITLIR